MSVTAWQDTAPTLEQTPIHPQPRRDHCAPVQAGLCPLSPHLDEAMKGIMRLSSELADVCQRYLQARVWMARDTGALKLRLA